MEIGNRGQIGLRMHGTSWMSRLIERGTRSDTHHVVIGIGDGLVVSAEPGTGVRVRPESDYSSITWSQFDWSPEQADTIVAYALAQLGRPYNYTAFVLVGLFGLAGLRVPRWLASLLSSRTSVDCSQLATEAIQAAAHFTDHPPWVIVPGDLQRLFELNGWPLPIGTHDPRLLHPKLRAVQGNLPQA